MKRALSLILAIAMIATMASIGFTASAATGDFASEIRNVQRETDSDPDSNKLYAHSSTIFFDNTSAVSGVMRAIAANLSHLEFNGRPVVVMLGWDPANFLANRAVGFSTSYDPGQDAFVQGQWDKDNGPFEVTSLVVSTNSRHVNASITTYKDNSNSSKDLQGYKIVFTPAEAASITDVETKITLQVNYREGSKTRTSTASETVTVEAKAAEGEFDGDRWILRSGVVNKDRAVELRNAKVQIGDFDEEDLLQIYIPRFASADATDFTWSKLATEKAEIANVVGFTSTKAVAAFKFAANRAMVADNVTVSISDPAIGDTSKTYNVYLVESGDEITSTVAGVKVTAAAEGIKLGGEFYDSLTFPLVNKMLGTYVITTAPLVNEDPFAEPEEDPDDVDPEEDPDVNLEEIDIGDAKPGIPVTGSSDVVAMTIFAAITALAAAGFVAVKVQ